MKAHGSIQLNLLLEVTRASYSLFSEISYIENE